MPVPRPTPENQEPRRLLRDVVYDKMFFAVMDGTLELGERLNDEELVRWLGVSRTPVREAIAKLAEQGLVDIEANRYTRIVSPTYDEFLDTITVGYDLWALVVRRGTPNLTDADRAFVVDGLSKRAARMAKGETDDLEALAQINDRIILATGSSMLQRLWTVTGPLTVLMFQRAGQQKIFPWEPGAVFNAALSAAIAENDAEKAAALVADQTNHFDEFFAAVRDSGIYPA